jgi:hypothetical protein
VLERDGCRRLDVSGRMGEGLSDHAIWPVVEQAATQIGIEQLRCP